MTTCPCGLSKNYMDCCGKFIEGQAIPNTPEELMRSRYSAFTQANVEYIAQTMKSPALDDFQADETREWAKSIDWQGLEIKHTSSKDDRGFVEFIAHLKHDHQTNTIHELSEFLREDGKWFYIRGVQPPIETFINEQKLGRNDPCSCGSGKKYKKCCLIVK